MVEGRGRDPGPLLIGTIENQRNTTIPAPRRVMVTETGGLALTLHIKRDHLVLSLKTYLKR